MINMVTVPNFTLAIGAFAALSCIQDCNVVSGVFAWSVAIERLAPPVDDAICVSVVGPPRSCLLSPPVFIHGVIGLLLLLYMFFVFDFPVSFGGGYLLFVGGTILARCLIVFLFIVFVMSSKLREKAISIGTVISSLAKLAVPIESVFALLVDSEIFRRGRLEFFALGATSKGYFLGICGMIGHGISSSKATVRARNIVEMLPGFCIGFTPTIIAENGGFV
jgi:hypothetical protein